MGSECLCGGFVEAIIAVCRGKQSSLHALTLVNVCLFRGIVEPPKGKG